MSNQSEETISKHVVLDGILQVIQLLRLPHTHPKAESQSPPVGPLGSASHLSERPKWMLPATAQGIQAARLVEQLHISRCRALLVGPASRF